VRHTHRPRVEQLEDRLLLKAPSAAPSLGPPPPPGANVVWVDTVAELQTAVRNLHSNQTIVIEPGTYNLTETLIVGRSAQVANVTLRGATDNFDDVVLRGRGMENPSYGSVPHGISVWNAQDVTIANLSVGDVYYHPIDLQGQFGAERVRLYHNRIFDGGEQLIKSNPGNGGADDCVVEYNLVEYTNGTPVTDHGGGTGYTGGISAHDVDNWIIRHNVWRDFHTPDTVQFIYNPVVLVWRGSTNTVVEGNTFINCDRAVALGLDTLATPDHRGGVIRNNYVWMDPGLWSASRRAGITSQIAVYNSPDTQVYHNTILTNGNSPRSIEVRWATTVDVRNNLADAPLGTRDGGAFTQAGNYLQATLSMFVNAAGGDFRLALNSATQANVIDRASPLAAVTDDWEGEARPQGTAADVGADEYAGFLPQGRVIDNGNAGFSTSGAWQTYQGPEVFQGDLHFTTGGGGANTATWTFTGLTPGASYRVSATWFAHALAATDATFTLSGGAAPLTVSRNQQANPNDFFDAAAWWEDLAATYTVTGTTLTVTLSDLADGYVEADAVRIEPVGQPLRILDSGNTGFSTSGPTPWQTYVGPEAFQSDLHFIPAGTGANTATWTFTALPPGTYRVSATWFGHPLGATDAPFTVLDGAAPLATMRVNQKQAPAGFTDAGALWQDVGVFTISSGALVVFLSDDADGYVMGDAIRVERLN
jgi:hypothetical protein